MSQLGFASSEYVKSTTQAHWQTDVLACWGLGSAASDGSSK